MDVSIIVCTYNRVALLAQMLESLSAVRLPQDVRCELVLVDNNSTDDTRDVVEAFRGRLSYPVNYVFEGRQGKTYALNSGIERSKGEILAFTDDDVQLAEGWLEEMLRPFASEDVLGVGGRILPAWTGSPPNWYVTAGPDRLMAVIVAHDLGETELDQRTPPFGANMAFRREAFSKYGVFRADLGGAELLRGEDTEFATRLLENGERIVYAPLALVHHPVEQERATKRYYRTWYFDYGRAEARLRGFRPEDVRWFGIPRHMIRTLGTQLLRWLTRLGRKGHFTRQLQIFRTVGAIVEGRRIHKATNLSMQKRP